MEYIIRNCGGAGWLGLVMKDNKEIYRTGKHHRSEFSCLGDVIFWVEGQS